MSTTRRVLAGGAVGALAALAATGGAGAARAHTDAATTPSSARLALTVSVSAGTLGSQTVHGSGQVDFATHQAQFSADLPAGTPGGGGEVQAVIDGGTVYVSVPALSSLLGGGGSWVSMSAPASDAANVASGFAQAASELGDAQGIVSALQADGATASSLGSRTVGGVTETGQRVEIDVAKLLTAQGAPASAVSQATSTFPAPIPVDVWADGSGRVAELSVQVAPKGQAQASTVSVTLDATGYDAPVSITVPPASATHALPSGLLNGLSPMLSGQLGVTAGDATVLSHLQTALLGHHGAHHPRAHHHRPRR